MIMDATLNRVIAGRDISIAPPALRAGGSASTARRWAAQESLTLRYQGLDILQKDYGNERIMKQQKSVEWYCKYSNRKLSVLPVTGRRRHRTAPPPGDPK